MIKLKSIYIFTGGLIVWVGIYFILCNPGEQEKEVENIRKSYQSEIVEIEGLEQSQIFDLRFSNYKNEINSFKNIQLGMLLIIALTIMLLVYRTKKINLPFLSFTAPPTLIFITIYAGGLYLWANFGLTFNSLINSRLSLFFLVEHLEKDTNSTYYLHSIKHILADSSLLDNWFSYYFQVFKDAAYYTPDPARTLRNFSISGWLGLFIIYGVFFGSYIASIITSSVEFIASRKVNWMVIVFLQLFMISLLYFTFNSFSLKNPYSRNWLGTVLIWCGSILIVWGWKRIVLMLDAKKDDPKEY